MEFRGLRGNDRWLPHLFGHEGFGEVIEVGQGVTKVATGDNVVMGWIAGSGVDAPGTQFRSGDGTVVNAGPITTFSNFTVASENRLTRAPSGLAPDVAVLYGCALLTGAGIVLNEMNAPQNARIGVLGLGGVGLSALMTLISMGFNMMRKLWLMMREMKKFRNVGSQLFVFLQARSKVVMVRESMLLTRLFLKHRFLIAHSNCWSGRHSNYTALPKH